MKAEEYLRENVRSIQNHFSKYIENCEIEKIVTAFRENPEKWFVWNDLKNIDVPEEKIKKHLLTLQKADVVIIAESEKGVFEEMSFIFNKFRREQDLAVRAIGRDAFWYMLSGEKKNK